MIPRKKRIKRFIIHTLVKILIFAIALCLITYIVNFPAITNELAMGQFENDNSAYGFWDTYNTVRNSFNSLYDLIIYFFVGVIISNIVTFIKYNKGEK